MAADWKNPKAAALRAARVLSAGLIVVPLVGCRSYEARPLDLEQHSASWYGRTLADGSLEEFRARLDDVLIDTDVVEAFDPEDGLTLAEGRLVALAYNPGLRLARLSYARAAASAEYAGLWDDPQLAISVLRATESIPDPWILSPALTFNLPISGRLGVQEDQANAERRAERYRVFESEWNVWTDVRQAWVTWTAARLSYEEATRLIEAMDSLVDTARQLADAGEMARPTATLFQAEQVRRQTQLVQMLGEVEAAEQELRTLIGLSPSAPVTFQPSFGLGEISESAIQGTHPTLVRLRAEYEVAEESLRLEIRRQVPDLTLGPQYELEDGQSRIGILAGIPIPIFNRNRRAIAEAEAEREIARARFETTFEIMSGGWARSFARAEALTAQRQQLEEVLVPLVERQLEDALELVRLGEGAPLVLLESLTRAQDAKLQLIDARAAECLARVELERLAGPRRSLGDQKEAADAATEEEES